MSEPSLAPIRAWLAEPMDKDVSEAIERLASFMADWIALRVIREAAGSFPPGRTELRYWEHRRIAMRPTTCGRDPSRANDA